MKKIASTRLMQAFVSIVAFCLGILAGPILETRVSPLLSNENIPLIVFVLMVVVLGTSIVLWGYSQKSVYSIEENIDKLAKFVGSQVRILPYTAAYRELMEKITNAQSEIRILTRYVFDWENGRPVYDPERLNSPIRRKVYDVLNAKIAKEKESSNFSFIRVVEIPSGHSLEEVFRFDEIYRDHCYFIIEISKEQPEFARIKVSDIVFDRTFLIIDRSFLYMEFEVRDPDTGEYKAPFTLIVEDQDSGVINELLKLHQRIDAKSLLFTG